jgi:hypothetical protein
MVGIAVEDDPFRGDEAAERVSELGPKPEAGAGAVARALILRDIARSHVRRDAARGVIRSSEQFGCELSAGELSPEPS